MENEIIWHDTVPRRYDHPKGSDIRIIQAIRNGAKTNILTVTFYNDCDQKITHTGRLDYGFYFGKPEMIYFRETDEYHGNKITKTKTSGRPRMHIVCPRKPVPDIFLGYFKLTRDPIKGLWRVNTENRIEEAT